MRPSAHFDIPVPLNDLNQAHKFFLDYMQNVWNHLRCPAYNLIVAYIYIERYVKQQNEVYPPVQYRTRMALTYANCHM